MAPTFVEFRAICADSPSRQILTMRPEASDVEAEASERVLVNPATGEELARVAESTEEEDRASRRAEECFRNDWRRCTPRKRSAALLRLAGLIRDPFILVSSQCPKNESWGSRRCWRSSMI